jgi:NADH-quinone oxidoreductase subunit G
MIQIRINNFNFLVKPGISVLEACKYVGIEIPRFCYHEILSVAGNCRICLVEIEKSLKPIASCALPVTNNMQIFINTPLVKKSRENILEMLLINHPLDCPICDQAGECDLQDQTKIFGSDFTRFFFNKLGVENKSCGPLIKTIMTRCIYCTRCVRFENEISGTNYLGSLNRGNSSEISGYLKSFFSSEISGNLIDLCPVGALTGKPYAFKTRPWELKSNESIDLMDSTGSNIYVNFKESELIRILPKNNFEINENVISDKARFSFDSLKNSRLLKIYLKSFLDKSVAYNTISWKQIFEHIDFFLEHNKFLFVIIDNELNIESLNILRNISNSFQNNIKIRSVSNFNSKKNYFSNVYDVKINDIKKFSKYCFLIAINLRLESAIINTKIRTKCLSKNISSFCLGHTYQHSHYNLEFINLNLQKIMTAFEGRDLLLSKSLISIKNTIIFLGLSLKLRFYKLDVLTSFLKKLITTSQIFVIKPLCNSSGKDQFSFTVFNKNDVIKSNSIIALNINDNLKIKKYLLNYGNKLFWFNSHESNLPVRVIYFVPVAPHFEDEGIFLNFEYRGQRSSKVLSGIIDVRSTKDILKSFFFNFHDRKYLNFIYETVNKAKNFLKLKNKLLTSKIANKLSKNVSYSLVCYYPLKPTTNNFYVTNKFSKHSITMQKCYKEIFNNSNNF